jgi:hypothetical protein
VQQLRGKYMINYLFILKNLIADFPRQHDLKGGLCVEI